MQVCFAFLETIGTSELLVIAFVALIVFGPRKLPELARKLGQSMGEFKRASDEFKRTWEHEVEMERLDGGTRASHDATVSRAGLPAVSVFDADVTDAALTNGDTTQTAKMDDMQTVARHSSHAPDMFARADPATGAHETTDARVADIPPGKEDWL